MFPNISFSTNKEEIKRNFISLKSDLDFIDAKMRTAAGNFENKTLYASHPVYQYLSETYDLNIISEHWEPDGIPGKQMWGGLANKLEEEPSEIMLCQVKPLPEIKKKLNNLELRIVMFNPRLKL